MKRRAFLRDAVVWTGLLWLPRAFGQQATLAPRARQFRGVAASTSCQVWKSQTTNNDYWGGSVNTYQSQKVKNDAGSQVDVCKVRFWFKNGATQANVYVKARTAQSGSGADIGSASDTVVVAANHNNWVDFTWTSGAPSIAGGTDFWIGWFSDQSHEVRVGYDTSAPVGEYYEDPAYCLYRGSSAQTDSDMVFEVWTLQ